jgi:hypothetical protein
MVCGRVGSVCGKQATFGFLGVLSRRLGDFICNKFLSAY